MGNLTAREEKCLLLIQQIQEMHKQGLGIAEIARRTGKDIGTVKKYRSGGNSLGTKRTGFKKSMDADYITRAGIFNHIWMGIELTDIHKKFLWDKYDVLYEIGACVSEFRTIFGKKNISLLYLFIERYKKLTIKEIASFAKGLERDIEAVENAVASDKSNGFVEETNSRLKMVKRTMYGRCGRHLLSAKLMYRNVTDT